MRTPEVIDTFTRFYLERGHRPATGTSLVPPDGDSVLFTTSGMHPLTSYLLGRPHPDGPRLFNVQRCLRTTDLDEVGDDTHLTCFTMLGTWSLGDYGPRQSLEWGYELLTDGFGIDSGRIHATVWGGDSDVEPDLLSETTWTSLGVPSERTTTDNWWSNGETGPCGPDSEIFVWTGDGQTEGTPSSDERWVEVWNHVMMRHHRHPNGSVGELERSNVDTGMGLERLVMVLQGHPNVFDTDMFDPWRPLQSRFDLDIRTWRLVSDHLRSSFVVIGDGIVPSNTGRGYVLRRLVRRALTGLWRHNPGISVRDLEPGLLDHTSTTFGTSFDSGHVLRVLGDEEDRFRDVVRRGRPLVERLIRKGPLRPDDYRWLRETHGLPREVVDSLIPT